MALHAKNAVRERLADDIYCSHDVSVAVPKYRFPNHVPACRSMPMPWCTTS